MQAQLKQRPLQLWKIGRKDGQANLQVPKTNLAMVATNQKNPRCIALQGTIGEQVSCGMYELRSTSCKEVQVADVQCNKARIAHNMIPFIQIMSLEDSAIKRRFYRKPPVLSKSLPDETIIVEIFEMFRIKSL